MISLKMLSHTFAATGALKPDDFAEAARLGFATIINFRPDNETPGQLDSHAARNAANAAGLAYIHLPAGKCELFADTIVSASAKAIASSPRPILAHCASGQRAAIIWAAVSARSTPVNEVLSALASAQFDLDFLRDDLEAQSDRARWNTQSDAQPGPHSSVDGRAELAAA